MKPILLTLSLLLLAAVACSSQEVPLPDPETATIAQATTTPTQTTGQTPPAATTAATATAGATATPLPTPHPGDALATELTSRATTPEPTRTQPLSESEALQSGSEADEPTNPENGSETSSATSHGSNCHLPESPQQEQRFLLSEYYECVGYSALVAEYGLKEDKPILFPLYCTESRSDYCQQAERRTVKEAFLHYEEKFGITPSFGYWRHEDITTPLSVADTTGHPYLHIFPSLEHGITNSSDNGEAYYFHVLPRQKQQSHPVPKIYGAEHFLANPFFEPVDLMTLLPYGGNPELDHIPALIGPAKFGENSLRDVLANAVHQGLTEMARAQIEPNPVPLPNAIWHQVKGTVYDSEILKDYITTPLWMSAGTEEWVDQSPDYGYHDNNYFPPIVSWELVSDNLPIVQVTAWNKVNLPLKQTAVGDSPQRCPMTNAIIPTELCGLTSYAVSFVVAFQNRWYTFDEEHRWINRINPSVFTPNYGNNSNLYPYAQQYDASYGADPDPKANYADRWHYTDYTHYAIIGAIAIQVIESEVIEPGMRFITPDKNIWRRDGIPLTDDFLQSDREYGKPEGNFLPRTLAISPNPGFPLPGHVLTNAGTQPGTQPWNSARANGIEEYLKSWNNQ